MINYLKIRDKIQNDIIRKYLLGPMNGPEEIIKNDSPLNFYITGILYPQEENNLNDDGSESERNQEIAIEGIQEKHVISAGYRHADEDSAETSDQILLTVTSNLRLLASVQLWISLLSSKY